ncbi:YdcF family protein [Herbaspirillum sp. RV1423]|uniref:YdcF family protein n=1 Tax=Herbaspirillum sp. RV1423 TaxID=1443993 RepID=UPI0004AFBA9B|nr:YdcF family protein [Herbaspirillum sp. RV1423]
MVGYIPFLSNMNSIAKLVSVALLFPLNLLLLAVLGLLLQQYWRRAVWLCWVALASLGLFSTHAGALLLAAPLESQTPVLATIPPTAQAIVVLGGGRLSKAPEYGDADTPNYLTLARLQYAARLHRASGLPVLVSGGKPDGSAESEAEVMARSLQRDFGVEAKWQEKDSDTTADNAILSARILRQAGVRRILLVTDAMHMPRAVLSFRKAGLEVMPAPTVFFSRERLNLFDFLPGGEGLRRSNYALHEWIGMLWYQLR